MRFTRLKFKNSSESTVWKLGCRTLILQDIIPLKVDLHMIKYITINISRYHV